MILYAFYLTLDYFYNEFLGTKLRILDHVYLKHFHSINVSDWWEKRKKEVAATAKKVGKDVDKAAEKVKKDVDKAAEKVKKDVDTAAEEFTKKADEAKGKMVEEFSKLGIEKLLDDADFINGLKTKTKEKGEEDKELLKILLGLANKYQDKKEWWKENILIPTSQGKQPTPEVLKQASSYSNEVRESSRMGRPIEKKPGPPFCGSLTVGDEGMFLVGGMTGEVGVCSGKEDEVLFASFNWKIGIGLMAGFFLAVGSWNFPKPDDIKGPFIGIEIGGILDIGAGGGAFWNPEGEFLGWVIGPAVGAGVSVNYATGSSSVLLAWKR